MLLAILFSFGMGKRSMEERITKEASYMTEAIQCQNEKPFCSRVRILYICLCINTFCPLNFHICLIRLNMSYQILFQNNATKFQLHACVGPGPHP